MIAVNSWTVHNQIKYPKVVSPSRHFVKDFFNQIQKQPFGEMSTTAVLSVSNGFRAIIFCLVILQRH